MERTETGREGETRGIGRRAEWVWENRHTFSIFPHILALGTSRPGIVLLTAALRKCPMASTGDKFQKQLTFRKQTAKGKLSSQPLEKTKGWRIPWTEEPGGLQAMGLQRVGHDLGSKELKRTAHAVGVRNAEEA